MSLHGVEATRGRTTLPERNLDALRATAVLLVFADHLGISAGVDAVAWYGYWAGRCGVLLFFVHTALVLMASLERNAADPHWVRTFYVRRAFRIYPLAIATVATVLLLAIPPVNSRNGIVPAFVMPDWPTIVANLALVQNLFGLHKVGVVLWTLPIEVEMYVLLPACYVIARRHGVGGAARLIAIAAIAFALIRYDLLRGGWRIRQLARFAPCFLGGVLAYALLRVRQAHEGRKRIPPWMWIASLPVSVVLMAAIAFPPSWALADWLFALAVGATIPFVRDAGPGRLAALAKTIAKYSYGFYLAHVPAMWAAFVVLRPAHWLVQWSVLAALLVALPWAAYHAIERPGIRLGLWLTGRMAPLEATAPAP